MYRELYNKHANNINKNQNPICNKTTCLINFILRQVVDHDNENIKQKS